MSPTTKLHLTLTIALLAAAAFLFTEWLAAHDAFLRADAQSKSTQSALAQLTKATIRPRHPVQADPARPAIPASLPAEAVRPRTNP